MKITKTAVESLETTGKRYSVFDDKLKGFAVRVGAKGDRAFYYVYRAGKGRGAQLKWLRLGAFPSMTVEQARRKAEEISAKVSLGADPAGALQDEKAAPTIKTALDMFYDEHVATKLKASSAKMYRGIIDRDLVPAIGKMKAAKVEYRHMAAIHHAKADAPYLANRIVAVASKAFAWMEKHGIRERGANPCIGLEKYKEHKRRKFMDVDELAAIGIAIRDLEAAWHEREGLREQKKLIPDDMEAITPQAAAVLRLLALTGARCGEILSLRWEHLDLEQGIAILPDSKTGHKVLHLPEAAVEILNSLPVYFEWVFPGGKGREHMTTVQKAWQTVCKKAGLTGWRVHDLRHAFASMAVNSGHSLPQVGGLLGHTQATTTQRYAHLAENPIHKVAEDTGARIAAAMARPKKSAKVIQMKRQSGGSR